MNRKKSLYELLQVSPIASTEEIRAAHQRALQKLLADEPRLSREDYEFKTKIINLALETLADPVARQTYDGQLAELIVPPAASRNALVLRPETIARKAEAMAFKADAMALRADAMAIRADVAQIRIDDNPSMVARVFATLKSPLKRLLVIFGTLAATAMVVQVAFLYFAVNRAEQVGKEAAAAQEKLIVQEHYQQYGERPQSAIEAKLLEEEHRRRENEERAAERERERAEEENRRFHQEFKREAEQVSAELRHAEEIARREEAYRKAQLEQEQRRQERAEQQRAEREAQKWRDALYR